MDLNSTVEKEFRITERQKKALHNLGLKKIGDLLFYFPSRYENFSERKNIIDLQQNDKTTVYGKITDLKNERARFKKLHYTQAVISDFTGNIKAVWFRQPYIANILKIGDKVALTGKITSGKNGLYLANPSYEKISSYENLGEGGSLLAVYPETRGITSLWIRSAIRRISKGYPWNIPKGSPWIDDPIPEKILKKYHLPSLKSSLLFIHAPQKENDAEVARKRFAFEEIFFIQLARLKEKNEFKNHDSFNIKISQKELDNFISIFPFTLTNAQQKSIGHVINDFSKNSPMSRLLEGDVGSGKTAVAVVATYAIVKNGFQVAYMAPTEILAQQHFQSFINYFSQLRLTTKIGLITSSECKKYPSKVKINEATHISKSQLLKWTANGEIPILIGTHSLIQKNVKFKNLAFVIIDEQHRFGTRQRAQLVHQPATLTNKRGRLPHLLSMTATPIPRTLALTIYGDLDLSLLDETPPGRKKIMTVVVPPNQRDRAYEQIRQEINDGRQAYIICPRIDEPDPEKLNALNVKAVKAEAKILQEKIFSEFKIEILHGKLKPKEKEKILEDFRANKIQILVSTSVIEVGIDVPNATMIVIEGADRFGLAQLHQLRGRVMRSTYQPYCFIFTDSKSSKTKERLDALVKTKNGFELAEYDLQFRGAGELGGTKQWGVSDLGMEALKNIKMVEAARLEAQNLLNQDPELKKSPLVREKLSRNNIIHFE
ncbi:ATP-dependent DNA helicase RecG [Patescibacteria group bacterium]|nr:ATP-dependent DNA helicase RecG [Patescibacteria group bacterium]